MTKRKLSHAILESKLGKKIKAAILEMDVADAEYSEPSAGEGESDWRDHLVNAVATLVKSDDEADHAKAKKILAMMEPEKAEALEESDDEEGDDGKPGKKKDADASDDKDEKKKAAAVEESRELFKLAGVKASTPLLEAAAGIKSIKARMAYINALRESIGENKGGVTKPPPGAPRGTSAVLESADGRPVTYDTLLTTNLM